MPSVRLVIASQMPMTDTKVKEEGADEKGQREGVLKIKDFTYAYDNPSQRGMLKL